MSPRRIPNGWLGFGASLFISACGLSQDDALPTTTASASSLQGPGVAPAATPGPVPDPVNASTMQQPSDGPRLMPSQRVGPGAPNPNPGGSQPTPTASVPAGDGGSAGMSTRPTPPASTMPDDATGGEGGADNGEPDDNEPSGGEGGEEPADDDVADDDTADDDDTMEPPLEPGICDNNQRDGDETGIDCGGSCPACPEYQINQPNAENQARSACEGGGTGFMCPRSMVFSPEMKQAVMDDWGMDEPPFVYGVVGHDPDPGGVDGSSASYSSTCCQCYQLVFKGPRDAGVSVPAPKPMIVQAFNTYAGGPTAFDVYMAAGGYGNFNGCTENGTMYSNFPDMGGDWTGGVRATRYGQCSSENGFTAQSISSDSCQDYVENQCSEIQASEAVQRVSQQSCVQSNRLDSHYHMNWNVVVKRVECPENLTRVTGCRLNNQGLPEADPNIQTASQAMQNGFLDGDYHTTTMQDCCRPTCAWPTNVTNTTGGWGLFYSCDRDGNVQ